MPDKKARVSILFKGLALVAIPLICELLFVALLLNLQSKAVEAAKAEARAHEVSDAMVDLVFNMVAVVRNYDLNHIRESEKIRVQSMRNLKIALARIKEQVADDPEKIKVVNASEQGVQDAENIIDELKAAAIADDPQLGILAKAASRRMDEASKKVGSPELHALVSAMNRGVQGDAQFRAEEQIHNLILGLLGVSVLVSLCLALYFSKEIASRINEVSNNAEKFSMRRPLGPPLKGNDEIASLDETFRTMARHLEAATRKQQAIFNNARDMILSLDKGLVVTSVNPACSVLLGQSVESMMGARIVNFITESDKKAFADAFAKLSAGDTVDNIAARMVASDGELIDVDCTAQWSREEQAFICVVHNISDMKKAERLRQEVVNMVTHDIRSPLNAVMSFEELLGAGALGELSERGQRLLKLSKQSNLTINMLINDLLDIEKIRDGKLTLEKTHFKIGECLERSVETLAVWADSEKIQVQVESSNDTVHADQHRIQQVVTNLLSNAIKFSGGGKSVLVRSLVNGPWLTVEVIDEGPGIPEDELNTVFERFGQGKSKKEHLGSGLGLSICKALVELHGGTISVQSTVGKGTTISFKVPATASTRAATG
jgi:PAS domain S-box-containing protein